MSKFADDTAPSGQPVLKISRFRREEAPDDFALALQLRTRVFVEEQNVPIEREQDAHDNTCHHWLIIEATTGEPVATGRLREYQEGCQMRPVAKIERVAVDGNRRGQRLGDRLMRAMLEWVHQEGYEQAVLDAQAPVIGFYKSLGFVSEGDEFMDAGIPHYRMRLVL